MRHIPEAGAVCGNPARTDLCGGRGVNLRSYRNNWVMLYRLHDLNAGQQCKSLVCRRYQAMISIAQPELV